ncbi:hypothetical protein [Bradyrhizobium sp. USDA 4545]|uniref:hypothetical protein n=1 Tax=Bradyrhizobium sp. USDA 4545 TaxID=2817705 RepID=UPI0020A4A69C|nr:hypothetical protein [Bradyrhizobium sp. USDA 4545]MCP1832785.1 hypothetical protein [Bradyrhizobium sp. USDA 4545]
MTQLAMAFDASPSSPFSSPERRIDITLDTVRGIHEAMSDSERAELAGKKWWSVVLMVSELRAMERGEEEALGRPSKGLADAYDAIITPGEHAIEALLRTFAHVYSQPGNLVHA